MRQFALALIGLAWILILFSFSAFAQGPVAWYMFNGNARDTSGNGLHGTLSAEPPVLVTDRFGNSNNAYSFTGSSNYISITDPSSLLNFDNSDENSTFSVWVYLNALADDDHHVFIDREVSEPFSCGVYYRGSDDRFVFNMYYGWPGIEVATDNSVVSNRWYHLARVIKDDTVKIYVDGSIQAATQIIPSPYPTTNSDHFAIIGRYNFSPWNQFNGRIDDIIIYGRALQSSEIDAIYHSGGWDPTPPVISSFTPTSGSVGTIVTITGTNFNWTPSNNVVYFGGVKASVTNATSTSLTVPVPAGATYAPITVTDTTTGLSSTSTAWYKTTFDGAGSISASTFADRSTLGVKAYPSGMSVADFNTDGKPDIAVGYVDISAFVSIFPNSTTAASISFGSRVDIAAPGGRYPRFVVSSDFDGDGRIDIAACGSTGIEGFTLVWRNISNQESIAFESHTEHISGNSTDMAVGDLDRDGKPDMVVIDVNGRQLRLYRNTSTKGSVSFALSTVLPLGDHPNGIAIVDIDGDGKLDIVQALAGSAHAVVVYRNTSTVGNFSFVESGPFSVSNLPVSLAVADLDGDNKLDIVTTGILANDLNLLRNMSSVGSVAFATVISLPSGSSPVWVSCMDVDGDAKSDIVTSYTTADSASIYKNNSSPGSFSFAGRVNFATGNDPRANTFGDLDGDGKPDLLISTYADSTLSFYRNISQDLVAYYPFTGGSTADSSGNGNNGTNNGATQTTDRFGNANSAYYFDGSDSIGAYVVNLPIGNAPRSLAAFMKMDDPGALDGYVAGWGSGEGWYLNVYQNNYRLVNNDLMTSTAVQKLTWRHFVATFDGDTAKIYVDGNKIAQGSRGYNTSLSHFKIGSHNNGGGTEFEGSIDDIYLYSRALSATEVYSLYRVGGWDGNLPSAPANLAATAKNQRVDLRWKANTESNFMRYRIYRGTSANPTTQVDSTNSDVGKNDTTKTFTGLVNGTTYYFRITAVDSMDNMSGYSNEVFAAPFNSTPIVQSFLPDTSYDEDFGRVFVRRLTDVFHDPDGDTLTFQSSDLSSGVNPSISNDSLYLNSVSGDTTDGYIRITASDDEITVADTFLVVVRNINDPPYVAIALRDTSFQEDFGDRFLVNLGTVFSDIDNSILSFAVYSPTSGVTARESNDSLYLSSVQNDTGSVNVRVTASDGEYTIADSFEVTLHNVNDVPDVIQPVSDRQFAEDSGKQFVTLVSSVFSDPENDELDYTAQAFNLRISTLISNDSLYVITSHDSNGIADVRVWATDPFSGTGSDTFRVTITPVNDGPIVVQAIPDTTVMEDFGTVFHRHMMDVFFDVDGPLTYHTNGPPSGLDAFLSGDSLYLRSTMNDTGSVAVILVANDGQDSAATEFSVNVTNVNDAVTLAASLQDRTLPKNFGRLFVGNLDSVFHDVDNSVLQYSPANLGTGVTADVVLPDSLFLNSMANFFGEVDVRVTASDGQFSLSDTFRVTVSSNTAPYVTNALRDTSFDEDFGVRFIRKLSTAFADTETTILSYEVDVLTPGVHAQIVDSDSLFITDSLNFNGQAAIRVSASDGIFETPATFIVQVMPVNDPPFVSLAIADQLVREDSGQLYAATLSTVFSDPDTNTLTYTVNLSNAKMTDLVSSDSLYLTTSPDSNGTTTVIVAASDQAASVSDTFLVAIESENDPPFIISAIPDKNLAANFRSGFVAVLSGVFADIDHTTLSYGAAVIAPGVRPLISNDSLYISDSLNFVGISRIAVMASDGQAAVSDSFNITVTGVPPALVSSSLAINPSTPSVGQQVSLSIRVDGTTPEVTLHYGKGSSNVGDSVSMSVSNGNTYSASIPGSDVTVDGLWFYIHARSMYGLSSYPSSGSGGIPVGITDISAITVSGAFPRGIDSKGYSTLALPLRISSPISLSDLFGEQQFNGRGEPTNWVAYTHVGGATGDTSFVSVSSVKNGEAYFVYQTVADTISIFRNIASGSTYPPDTLEALILKPGWNLIAWPYCFSSSFTVTDVSKIDPPWIRQGARQWELASVLRPFGAYAIKNKTSGDVVLGEVATWSTSVASLMRPAVGTWSVRLEAHAGLLSDRFNAMSISDAASNELDDLDISEPIDIGESVSLYFGNGSATNKLAYDVRSSDAAGHTWDMFIRNNSGASVINVGWELTDVPDNVGFVLVDIGNNRFVDLGSATQYQFRSRPENNFKMIGGTLEYVAAEVEKMKELLPREYALHQNYPNPFNPYTSIAYDLARSGQVKLKIYNILGQEVVTLFDGYEETGHYVRRWDGKNRHGSEVASGVYICRLETGGFVKNRKMLLVK